MMMEVVSTFILIQRALYIKPIFLNNLLLDGGVFYIHLNPECLIYKAHFPEQPITPGVCITQIAVELAEIIVGHSLQMIGIKNVKFLSIMTPDTQTEVTYTITIKSSDDNNSRIQAVAQSDDVVYAKMSLICKR